jgi:hypothetical protein
MRSTGTIHPSIRALLAATAVLLLLGGIGEQELECEEAFAHVESCCYALGVRPICGDGGCDTLTLSLAESTCIQALGCDDLRAAGICERVAALDPHAGQDESAPREEVCP